LGAPPLENQTTRRTPLLGYLFARLWKNPFARYGSLAAAILIVFSVIFSARDSLYRYFSRAFSSPGWSDVVRHGHKPFGFEENEDKARNLTEKAWREIYDLAQKHIGEDENAKDALRAPISHRPYSTFLQATAERKIFSFFNGLKADCGQLETSMRLADNARPMGNLAFSLTVAGELHSGLNATMRELLKIHAKRVVEALEMKPDYLPALEISEEIFRATCNMRVISTQLANAIDYRQYFLQKQIYLADGGRLYDKNPELFDTKSNESYARDSAMRVLHTRYFEATKYRTPYEPAHLLNMRNAYSILKSERTLASLVDALLAEARNSTPAIAKKCHFELFALDYPGITDRADYVYALAETAFLGAEPDRAFNIVSNAIDSGKIKNPSVLSDLNRLRFQLKLTRHESENISGF
jgi:hypothetical protein